MDTRLKAIQTEAQERTAPNGERYTSLSLAAVHKVAREQSCSCKDVELTALQHAIIPERYQRSLGTTGGADGQVRLLQSRAAVIGLGGLGGLVAELLARMGVGTLVLADSDNFNVSNLNRQVLATEENLGESKAGVAAKRLQQVNAAVTVEPFQGYVDADNAVELLRGCQVVVDCLDNLKSRYLLQSTCRELDIPLVHGAIAQFVGQVSTIFPGDPGLEAIYGPPEEGKDKGIEVELGNPAATPALVAAWQVQEAIKILLDTGTPLRNRLLFLDTEAGTCDIFQL